MQDREEFPFSDFAPRSFHDPPDFRDFVERAPAVFTLTLCPPEANFALALQFVEMASCDAEPRVTLAATWQDGIFLLLPLVNDIFVHTPLPKGGRIFLMSDRVDLKIVRAWAVRLGKSEEHIARLIKAGIKSPKLLKKAGKPVRALPYRYPRTNEGPPLTAGAIGRVPPRPSGYVVYDLGRKRPSKSSVIGKFDELLGTKGSAREKLLQRIIAELTSREIATSEEQAVIIAVEVMGKAKTRRCSWQEALRKVVTRRNENSHKRERNEHALPPLKAFDRIQVLEVKRAVERLHKFAKQDELGEWSTSGHKAIYIPAIRKWQSVLRKFLRELARSLDPKGPKELQSWSQARFASELGMSVDTYRKFLKRSGLSKYSAPIRQIHRKRVRVVNLRSGGVEALDTASLHSERGDKHRTRPMRSAEFWTD
jgi:hypothetical protein